MTPLTSPQVYVEELSAAGIFSIPVADIVMFTLVAILIFCIVWLSSRHIRISRAHIYASEKILESERDSLERRIAERTTAFVRAEEQRMIELERNAEFGKLSQGLFHDLISPLSSISLYAQQFDGHINDSEKTKEMIRTIIESSHRMNSFMESVRRSLGGEVTQSVSSPGSIEKPTADLQKEINIVLDILGYKARMNRVDIRVIFDLKSLIILPTHPVRLHQLILNLVSNAIDTCIESSKTSTEDQVVTISVNKISTELIELSVSDTGCGISAENQTRLFRDQFTTKKNGSGIGMMTVKTIVKQDLGGTIEVSSEAGKGARFMIKIPYSR